MELELFAAIGRTFQNTSPIFKGRFRTYSCLMAHPVTVGRVIEARTQPNLLSLTLLKSEEPRKVASPGEAPVVRGRSIRESAQPKFGMFPTDFALRLLLLNRLQHESL